MRLPERDRLSVLSRALASTDPFTRMVAATHVREASAGQDRAALLAIMDRDPLASIRRQALYARLDADRATRDACLHAALLDRHRSMRHAGRFYLSEAVDDSGPRFDAPEFYRRAIASSGSRTLAAAIAGLGECGTRSDATLVARFASDAKPSVAAAAVRALARLDPDSHRDDFIRWMADHRSKVTREAYHAVMALGSAIDVSQVRDAMAKAASPLAKRLALRVLVSRHPYDAVVDAIIAAADPCTPLAADAARYIKSLREHSATYGATVAQKAAVVNAVASVGDRLDVSLRDHALRVIGVSRP
jgi:hypothetical protein